MADGNHSPVVWHNGRLLKADDVRISPFDQGLTIGLGAFETLVAAGGEPFAFSRHWNRLVHSCRGLGLPVPDRTAIADALRAVAAANHHRDGRLRITVTAGSGPLGSDRPDAPQPTCLVVSAPRPVWPPLARVIILPWPRHEHSPLAGIKSTSYAENSLALAEARRHHADEALFTNTAGHLCEGSGSNVFLVRDGQLLTPPLTDGCLAGVTRALVLELARELGIPTAEPSLPTTFLTDAAEAFLTSTTRDIHPITEVDHYRLSNAPGPVTRRLQDAWHTRFPAAVIDP
jgi:branched-chain amino acid aminotransferase